jgi:hypothetical protein
MPKKDDGDEDKGVPHLPESINAHSGWWNTNWTDMCEVRHSTTNNEAHIPVLFETNLNDADETGTK